MEPTEVQQKASMRLESAMHMDVPEDVKRMASVQHMVVDVCVQSQTARGHVGLAVSVHVTRMSDVVLLKAVARLETSLTASVPSMLLIDFTVSHTDNRHRLLFYY